MKIAIIGPAHPYRGGIATYNERLARHFQGRGYHVELFTFSLQYPNFLFPGKTQYTDEPKPNDLVIHQNINSINPFNWWLVGSKIKKEDFDIVISKFWLPFLGPCLGSLLHLSKRNKKTKTITIIDNIIPHEKRIGDTVFTKYFVSSVDALVAMSQNVYDDLNLFDTKKPRLLSPHPLYDNFGALDSTQNARKQLGLDTSKKYILFFGLIRAYKGLDLLLEAFAKKSIQNEDIRLIVAGEYYDDKSKYDTIIEKYHLKEKIISIEKFIPNSEVCHYFNAADLVVQPYKSATQSGVTQIAYHFNKPMVVTNVGGLEEMCPNEKVGYVVDPSPSAIADAILRFFNDTDISKMIENIKEEKQKYSWDILGDNILQLYSQVIKGQEQ